MSSIHNLANQLKALEQIYPNFEPATVAQLQKWTPSQVQNYAADLPGLDQFSNTLRNSLITLSLEKNTTPEINQ
jgi:hypothetical protein